MQSWYIFSAYPLRMHESHVSFVFLSLQISNSRILSHIKVLYCTFYATHFGPVAFFLECCNICVFSLCRSPPRMLPACRVGCSTHVHCKRVMTSRTLYDYAAATSRFYNLHSCWSRLLFISSLHGRSEAY